MMAIFGSVVQGLATALDLYHARQRVLTENVANAETPGYLARDLQFGAALREAFESGAGERAKAAAEPAVDRQAVVKIDRNSVDIDTEMARLSENAFKIVALSRMLARKYETLKTVITEGQR